MVSASNINQDFIEKIVSEYPFGYSSEEFPFRDFPIFLKKIIELVTNYPLAEKVTPQILEEIISLFSEFYKGEKKEIEEKINLLYQELTLKF